MATVIRTNEELLSAFECVICASLFETPKNLPNCGHTYCLACIEALPRTSMAKGGSGVTCPECRVVSPVGKQGVSIFQTNISTQRMVESMRNQLMKQSGSNICQSSDSGATAGTRRSAESCPHAFQAGFITFDCKHCNGKFCQACQIGHMERLKADIKNIGGKFEQRVSRATDNITERTRQITEFYSNTVETSKGNIEKAADEIIDVATQLIRKKADELVKQVEVAASNHLSNLRKVIENCQNRRIRLRQSIDHVASTSVLKMTLDEVVKVHNEVKIRDSQIKEMERVNQGQLIAVLFRPSENLAKAVESLESVSLGSVRNQTVFNRFNMTHSPVKLRQAQSCFDVSHVEPFYSRKNSVVSIPDNESEEADDEDDYGISEKNRFKDALLIKKEQVLFHEICGVNAKISSNSIRASKNIMEFTKGVCFTNRPIQPGERIQITCLLTDDSCIGGSAMGFTTLDPALVPVHYPELLNDDCLLNGGSHFFWVCSDTLSENGTTATFSYELDGSTFVELRNYDRLSNSPQTGEDKVPSGGHSLLWGVVNLFGTTSCIKIHIC